MWLGGAAASAATNAWKVDHRRAISFRCPKQSSSGSFSNMSVLSSRRYPSHSKRRNRPGKAHEKYLERLRKGIGSDSDEPLPELGPESEAPF
jgi:hypothetical protein